MRGIVEKLVSIPLAGVLALGMLPAAAFGALAAALPQQAHAATSGTWHGVSYDMDDSGAVTFHAGTMTGSFDRVDPFYTDEVLKDATSVKADGAVVLPTDSQYLFYRCDKLESIDMTGFDSSSVKNMCFMFSCGLRSNYAETWTTSLSDLGVSSLDTSSVTNMGSMFEGCSALTSLDVSGFDTSKTTNFSGMFHGCSALTAVDVSGFDTASCTSFMQMFDGCRSVEKLDTGSFATSQATTMYQMFYDCSAATDIDVSSFDTSRVTSMYRMFDGCTSLLSLDVSRFDTSKVTNMEGMFMDCEAVTALTVSGFDTSQVTRMTGMFARCRSLRSLDVSRFSTGMVTDMYVMFGDCASITALDVSGFDTSQVTDMCNMFRGCSSLKELDLSHFDTSKVTRLALMFSDCGALSQIELGTGFSFNGAGTSRLENSAFPEGDWLSSADGMTYAADAIPNNVAAVYTKGGAAVEEPATVEPASTLTSLGVALVEEGKTVSVTATSGKQKLVYKVRLSRYDAATNTAYVKLKSLSIPGKRGLTFTKLARKTLVISERSWNGQLGCVVAYEAIPSKYFRKARGVKTVVIPSTVRSIGKRAFAKSSVTKLQLRTRLLAKKRVRKSLSGSKMKKLQVKVAKKYRKKIRKKYKKAFAKKNSGRKVKVA